MVVIKNVKTNNVLRNDGVGDCVCVDFYYYFGGSDKKRIYLQKRKAKKMCTNPFFSSN